MKATAFLITVLLAPLCATRAQEKPNILFIAIDDLRPKLGCYGEPEPITPNIDRLAREGTRFDRAYVSYPLCLPSRAAMLTGVRQALGRLPDGSKGGFPEMIAWQQTLPATFHRAGYFTATHGKFYHGNVPESEAGAWDVAGKHWLAGVQDWSPEIARRVAASGGRADQLADFRRTGKGSGALVWVAVDGPDNLLNDGQVTDKTLEMLRTRPKEKPFFIVAGFSRPHMPWVAPKRYFDLYPAGAGKLPAMPPEAKRVLREHDLATGVGANGRWNEGITDEEAQKLIRGYMACTSYVDAQVGILLHALEAQGLARNTIVVLWGDHGYHLTEHGLWRKNTPYHVALRHPLLIRAPGVKAGQVVERVVESVDLYPTLVDLAGLARPAGVTFQGRSLVPLLHNPAAEHNGVAFTSALGHFGLVDDRYRFTILKGDAGFELYDLVADPDEWHNLADDPAQRDRIQGYAMRVRAAWNLKE